MRHTNEQAKHHVLVLRIGGDYVSDNIHYTRDIAQEKQAEFLQSPAYRAQPMGTVGICVMHYSTFRKLVREGSGVTTKILDTNVRRFGREATELSPLAVRVEELNNLFGDC